MNFRTLAVTVKMFIIKRLTNFAPPSHVCSVESDRPPYNAVQAKEGEETVNSRSDEENNPEVSYAKSSMLYEEKAPRSPDGELILRRREVHSGRSLTVSTVEWSVAEKKAIPTSALEGWMVSMWKERNVVS